MTNAAPEHWRPWLQTLFPQTFAGPMAEYHADYWDWLWGVPKVGAGPDGHNTYVAVWARGWAKSTNIETGVISLAVRSKRRYGWYISGQQAQADDHVGTVSEKIVSSEVAKFYPDLASARVQVIGERSRQRGWRRNRIWTADGFVLDALGLDSAIRGLKYEGKGTDAVITAGEPTWDVMGLDVCQAKIADAGIDSFLAECQHELIVMGNPRFDREAITVHELNVRDPLPRTVLPEWALDPYLSVWSLPIGGVPYVMYFDGAEGVGSDYCVTTVLRADTRQLVAMIRDNKREQREHAKVAAILWKEYNRGLVGWERSHEADFAAVMAAEGVDRIYEHPEEQTAAQRISGDQPTKRRGYPARQRERRVLVSRVARYLERHEGAIPSAALLTECKNFVKTAQQPDGEAGRGYHDDTVFSFGGALIMAEQPGAQSLRETSGVSNVRGYTPRRQVVSNVRGY